MSVVRKSIRMPSIGDMVQVHTQESADPVEAVILKKRISVRDGRIFVFLRFLQISREDEWRPMESVIIPGNEHRTSTAKEKEHQP